MVIAAIAIAVVALAVIGLITFFAVDSRNASKRATTETVARVEKNAELERERLAHEHTKLKLTEAERLADVFEEALADGINANPNADLPRNDVRARVLRAALKARSADADRGGPLAADASSAVPAPETAGGPTATELRLDGDTLMQP